ncbi:DUF3322 domain-containing protein [Pseudomonas sp. lyk4-R2A-8]|uniref:DUF3322 domain-containing protein n=1 Tax=Pseudomonas sp. lyk4-R2A-8 TaxID=3040316 RepID=UPI0025549BA5|nr:DUF3322 domain-containing protein [Pseudomonas sp. lyk4-R2A-8]
MQWTTTADLNKQIQRLWLRGDLLRPLVTGQPWEPRRLSLKGPEAVQLSEQFEKVRKWVADLSAIVGIRIQWREVNHRVVGLQRLPVAVWVDSLEAAVVLVGKGKELNEFKSLLDLTLQCQPLLVPWLEARPLRAITLARQWPALLKVVTWITEHPKPGIYLRQVDIPGIHSKFIEGHKGVLCELFDRVLPEQAIASHYKGASQFSLRYGFLDKPTGIRFRVLDQKMATLPGLTCPDITLDSASFAQLDIAVSRVFVTENETNFLAFPCVASAIVIFGKGYGWEALGRASWLSRSTIYYWGDIDTHGFAILDQLRRRFGHVESLLMDRQTLVAHEDVWGQEARQALHELPRLNSDERLLFDELRDNRLGVGVRLEQEYIKFSCLERALASIRRSNDSDSVNPAS